MLDIVGCGLLQSGCYKVVSGILTGYSPRLIGQWVFHVQFALCVHRPVVSSNISNMLGEVCCQVSKEVHTFHCIVLFSCPNKPW